ncbi:hypothetical protein [Aliidiomarina indica]|uniref:hypothetical protein n=1 Tax=Aliidiomarina indica TaxID=2749147 RepID=UPI00188F08F6|nr:hypothetical protein [Aliidiomarina indica]
MSAEQYLQSYLKDRIPSGKTLSDFYEASGNDKKELRQLADDIVELQTNEALSASSTQTKSYDELASERAKIVANMDLPDSQTDRVERERRLDDIQQEMEPGTQAGRARDGKIADKMDKLERLTNSILERM